MRQFLHRHREFMLIFAIVAALVVLCCVVQSFDGPQGAQNPQITICTRVEDDQPGEVKLEVLYTSGADRYSEVLRLQPTDMPDLLCTKYSLNERRYHRIMIGSVGIGDTPQTLLIYRSADLTETDPELIKLDAAGFFEFDVVTPVTNVPLIVVKPPK